MGAWATKGAQRARTLKPVLDFGIQVGELAESYQLVSGMDEVVDHVKRNTATKGQAIRQLNQMLKGFGGGGLYLLFGVAPLVEVATKLPTLTADLEKAIRRAFKHDGRKFHRHIKLKDTDTTGHFKGTNVCFPTLFAEAWMKENSGTWTISRKEKIWFETNLIYRIPPGSYEDKHKALRKKLLGVRLDGATLYELAPFSWMLDWFTSVGALLNNTMDHTYYRFEDPCIMHESRYHKTVKGTVRYYPTGGSNVTTTVHPYGSVKVTVKRRQGYTWGEIGLTLEPLANYQLAVFAFLAARSG
jgi:hypothetical protein